MTKCELCKSQGRSSESVWAMQDLGEELTFSTLGSHYRGFRVTKVCDSCRKAIRQEENIRTKGVNQ